MIIRQEHFYNLFMEIFNQSLYRILPDWVYANIERGVFLSSHEYVDSNMFEAWNDTFFINDRHRTTSFVGGIGELAWVLSYTDAALRTASPCLTREEQVEKALDFFIGGDAYQIKTVERGSFGDLQVRYEYLKTEAHYLVLLDPIDAKAYTCTPTVWETLKHTSSRDATRSMFWVHPSAIMSSGGSVRDLPEFIKRAKPQRNSI